MVHGLIVPVAALAAVLLLSTSAAPVGGDGNPGTGAKGSAMAATDYQVSPGTKVRPGVPPPLTQHSRTVRHADGTYTTTIYPGSVNYRTAAG